MSNLQQKHLEAIEEVLEDYGVIKAAQVCTEITRFHNMKKEKKYEPFGPEWEAELMKWDKKELINFLKTNLIKLKIIKDVCNK